MPLKRKSNRKRKTRADEPKLSYELPQVHIMDGYHVEEAQSGEFPLPEEQQHLARLWAMEEENDLKSWEESEELDYSKVAASLGITPLPELEVLPTVPMEPGLSRPALDERFAQESSTSPTKSNTHSLFSYAQSLVYQVQLLGKLSPVPNEWINSKDPNNIIKLTEYAQIKGVVPWTSQSGSDRLLILSKYGIKITDIKNQRVYTRHTLHDVIDVTQYTDVKGQSLLAIKAYNNSQLLDLYIYQCENEDQSTDICMMLTQFFDAISNKMKMEDNLIGLK